MPYTIEWVDDQEGFTALEREWDDLLGTGSMPFDRHCWYSAWWRAFHGGRRLHLCVAKRDGRLRAAFPLAANGRRLEALANVHTPVFRPIAADAGALQAVVRAVLESGFESLELPALPASDQATTLLNREARTAGLPTVEEPGHVSPIVDTSGAFDAWRRASKARWGAPLERFRRKMAREHEAVFSIVESPSDLEAQLRAGFAVEASGWKGEAGTAIISSPYTEFFYSEIARSFHDRGELRLSEISLDRALAAFDMCLLHRNRLYLLKTGFDEGFRKLAPGLVLRLSIIERCFALGLDAHELLGGHDEWKRKFSTAERKHEALRAYQQHPASLARYGYRAWLRPLLRRVYRSTVRRLPRNVNPAGARPRSTGSRHPPSATSAQASSRGRAPSSERTPDRTYSPR